MKLTLEQKELTHKMIEYLNMMLSFSSHVTFETRMEVATRYYECREKLGL